MAKSVENYTWKNGFREPASGPLAFKSVPSIESVEVSSSSDEDEEPHYVVPPSTEVLTSSEHNSLGLNCLRTWPTIYDGTLSPHGLPAWWKPEKEVDVIISGAGPAGLQIALSLARQGVSFRIIDKAETPLIAGRADGVQPRFLEILNSWGLASEVHEEGPLIERTAIYRDGKKLLFNISHQSDSRYRGLHIITQGQIERIYIRDLMRHKRLVERACEVNDFSVSKDPSVTHPVRVTLRNNRTEDEEVVKAKFLIGSDGAGSVIRKKLEIPFDGVSTDIYWGIIDCIFESDYPHSWVFGSVISSEHGGCVIIPREEGYIRLYTQLDVSSTGPIARSRQGLSDDFQVEGGKVEASSVTAEEVLAQANRIFAPYTVKFAAPISWFAVWKISERVARSFCSPDHRVFLAGDAAHIHSVMGAFGLNASILDSSNLAWKVGLCARNLAKLSELGSSYDSERRCHANRIIKVSGAYLRFVCNSSLPLADFIETNPEWPKLEEPVQYTPGEDMEFLKGFFAQNGKFLLGLDCDYPLGVLNDDGHQENAVSPRNGVRAPNPRVCIGDAHTGYLYDVMTGAAMIHLVIFASDLQGSIRDGLVRLSKAFKDGNSFFHRFGGKARFNPVLVVKGISHEMRSVLKHKDFEGLMQFCQVVFDDRAPDEDAHTWYGVNHGKGALVVVRPDLWVGLSVEPGEIERMDRYFSGWLLPSSS